MDGIKIMCFINLGLTYNYMYDDWGRRRNEVKEDQPNAYQDDVERVSKYSTPPYLNQIDNKVNNLGILVVSIKLMCFINLGLTCNYSDAEGIIKRLYTTYS